MILLRKPLVVMTLACFLTLGVTSFSVAAPGDQPGPNGAPTQFGQQLTPEQMAQIRRIFDENYASMNTTRQALTAKRAELDMELSKPAPDRSKIEGLSREIGELRGKMLAARLDVRNQLEKQGLPSDFYGNNNGPRGDWDGPRGWRQGHGRHHGWRGGYGMMGNYGMMGGMGCMGGCW